jgi:hypothetical protein
MISFTIKSTVTASQIQGLYILYLSENDQARGTKKQFISYMKSRVKLFGTTDDFLFGNLLDNQDLQILEVEQLMKWGLI